MITALARAPVARVARAPRTWLVVASWCALALVMALSARAAHASSGASRILLDVVGALVIPFTSYALAAAVLGPRSLAASVSEVGAFGVPAARVAVVAIAVLAAAAALVGALLAAAVAAAAHGISDPPVAHDAVTSAYVGALGGATYAAWFALGSTWGRRGGGRTAFLIVDWLLGVGTSPLALVSPRAHLRNLFGGAPPAHVPERASAAVLVAIGVAAALLATLRSERRP